MKELPLRGMGGKYSLDDFISEWTYVLLKYAQVLSMETIKSKYLAYVLAANLATTLDSETQKLVSEADRCNLAFGDGFRPPKSNPIIVNSEADVDGINFSATGDDFGGMKDETFAKLYEMRPAKSCLSRSILISIVEDPGNEAGTRHLRTESDIHAKLKHWCESILTDALYSVLPKFEPNIVTLVEPVTGWFAGWIKLIIGD